MNNKLCGIYCATHTASNRRYIGSSVNISNMHNVGSRKYQHNSKAKNGSMGCFHRALREFGESAFCWSVLELCDKSILLEREAWWIAHYDTAGVNGFNTRSTPSEFTSGYTLEMTDATKARISARFKGIPRPAWVGKKISDAKKANPQIHSPETRAKLRFNNLGKKQSPETIAKRAISLTGKKRSAEHCEFQRQRMLGTKANDATRAKQSAAKKGIVWDRAVVMERSATWLKNWFAKPESERKRTPESRAKMSASAKARGPIPPEVRAQMRASYQANIVRKERPQEKLFTFPTNANFTPLQAWALEAEQSLPTC